MAARIREFVPVSDGNAVRSSHGFVPDGAASSVNPALDLTIQKAEAGPHAISAGLLWWGLVLL